MTEIFTWRLQRTCRSHYPPCECRWNTCDLDVARTHTHTCYTEMKWNQYLPTLLHFAITLLTKMIRVKVSLLLHPSSVYSPSLSLVSEMTCYVLIQWDAKLLLPVSTTRVDGPSTRPVLTGNGNRSPVNSGRQLGYSGNRASLNHSLTPQLVSSNIKHQKRSSHPCTVVLHHACQNWERTIILRPFDPE